MLDYLILFNNICFYLINANEKEMGKEVQKIDETQVLPVVEKVARGTGRFILSKTGGIVVIVIAVSFCLNSIGVDLSCLCEGKASPESNLSSQSVNVSNVGFTEEQNDLYDLDSPPPVSYEYQEKEEPLWGSVEEANKSKEKKHRYENYIKRFAKTAIMEQAKYKIPASVIMAQGLLESNAGASWLVNNANAHFGIKCNSRSCKKGHCVNRGDDTHKDFFVKYESAWESYRAHSKLLTKTRYSWMIKKHPVGSEGYLKAWCAGLKKSGYATDKNYASKIYNLITEFELYRLDHMELD